MNFKKLSAAALAAGLALTAAPVFAADSAEGSDVTIKDSVVFKEGDNVYYVENDKNVSDVEKNAMASVTTDTNNAENRKEIIEAAGYKLGADCETVVLGSGFYDLVDYNKKTGNVTHVDSIPGQTSFKVSFQLNNSKENEVYKDNKTIYVMHFSEAKMAWEVKTAEVKPDGTIEVELESLSPVAFVGYKWTDDKGDTTYDAPKSDKTNWVPVNKDGGKPSEGYKPGQPATPGATTPEKPVGGTTSAGSTIANKVSPNTAA